MMNENTIKVGDKEYPCRLTMGAFVRYKRETGEDVSRMREGDLTSQVIFLWAIVASACSARGVEFTLGVQEFADRLDPSEMGAHLARLQAEGKKKETP